MNKLTPVFFLAACLLICSCKNDPVGGAVENTYWKLASIKEGNTKTDLNKGTDISAIFSKNKISGISTCNRYSGSYTAEGTALTVNDLSSTERMCDDIHIEQQYLGLLTKATGYSVLENGLVIFSENGQLYFGPMSSEEMGDIQYAEGVGRLASLFPIADDGGSPHFYPIVRVDRPGNYPYTGKLIDPELYQFFDSETSEVWNSTGGDVMAVGKYGDHYVCRVPGRYVSSDIALFRLENGAMKRSETIAWAWCDEGWCNQQDAWLQDVNKDGRMDIVQHYTLTDDKGKIKEERLTVLLQDSEGVFKVATEYQLDMAAYKMADI